MKRPLLILTLFLAWFAAYAQFNVQPSTSNVNFDPAEFDVHADATMTYTGSVPMALRWDIVNITGPKEWMVYTCLGNACYAPGQLSGMQEIQPNEQMIIQAHIFPQGGCGNGSYEITFTDTLTSQVVATAYFTFQCSATSISIPGNGLKAGAIYPNPAVTWFSLGETPGASRLEIFNMIGKQVAQFPYQFSGRYDISALPGGMYLVRVIDNQGKVLTTKRMSKTTP